MNELASAPAGARFPFQISVRRAFTGLLGLALLALSSAASHAALVYNVGPTEVIYSASQRRNKGLDHWVDGTVGTLAYLILTDQIPRNIHRGSAAAFATDPLARAAARKALEAGWDMGAPEPERQFFYMPFEHSEDPDDQDLAVRLLGERLASDPDMVLHARAHQEVIRRYGRFPTRNVALGRISSPDEQAYLDQGGYAALVNTLKDSHAPDA